MENFYILKFGFVPIRCSGIPDSEEVCLVGCESQKTWHSQPWLSLQGIFLKGFSRYSSVYTVSILCKHQHVRTSHLEVQWNLSIFCSSSKIGFAWDIYFFLFHSFLLLPHLSAHCGTSLFLKSVYYMNEVFQIIILA